MKNILLITSLLITFNSFSQKLIVKPNGLRDSFNISQPYLVINMEGKSAKMLYDYALKYVNNSYKYPEQAIKSKTEGESLKFDTQVESITHYNNSGTKIPINATYTTELSFKDGKVKYEITNMVMRNAGNNTVQLKWTSGPNEGYPIYKPNGELKSPESKKDIENHFEKQIKNLVHYLKGYELKREF